MYKVRCLGLIAVLLIACQACSAVRPAGSANDLGLQVPFPHERDASALGDYTVYGKDTQQRTAGVTDDGNAVQLASAAGVTEFAVYRYNPGLPLEQVEVVLGFVMPNEAYIGVADYTSGKWDFSGPFATTAIVDLDPARNISPLGNAYICVVVFSGGFAKVESLQLYEENGWTDERPAPGLSAMAAQMVVAAGNPAISFYDQTNQMLKFVRALDATGSAWALPVVIDSQLGAGAYSSLAIVGGNPAVTYQDGIGGLRYARASNAEGTAWGTPITIQAANVGWESSLAEVAGRPAVSFHDITNNDLLYCRAMDATGTAWSIPQVLLSNTPPLSVEFGAFNSLTVVNGNPAIALSMNDPDADADGLGYLRALDAVGSVWGPVVTIDGLNGNGVFCSMAVVNGRPAICYPGYLDFLYFVRADDADGTSWGAPLTVEPKAGRAWNTSLAMIDGKPAISYTNADHDFGLWYVAAKDADGTLWDNPLSLDSDASPGVGVQTSLLEVGGKPAVAYVNDPSPTNFFFEVGYIRAP